MEYCSCNGTLLWLWFRDYHYDSAHVVFERSTDREWQNPPGTSSDGRASFLVQVAWVLVNQRQEKLSVNN